MADSALSAFQAAEATGSPIEARQNRGQTTPGAALADFLAREELGSPLDAIALGRPANGPESEAPDPTAYTGDETTLHAKLVRWFEAAERDSADARKLAERDSDYRHGLQWTKAEQEALRKRGQPELTINYVRRKIELLCGLERKSRTDPKAYPRTPTEDNLADAATQALRYVADNNNMNIIRSAVYEDILVLGFGGMELGLEDDGKGGADVTMTQVSWERLWYDPHSRAADFSDARYLGLVLWMDEDQLIEMYPDAGDTIGDSFASTTGSYDDRPGAVSWQDSQRTRCRVVQCHWTERGEWWTATYTRVGLLGSPQQSPFKDRKGRPACPLVLQSAYVDRENHRYGAVRDLISLQDEINKRRSKALHLLTARTVIAEKGAVANVDAARREVAKPDGYVETMPGLLFKIEQSNDLAMGQIQLLQQATAEMQASGPNASMAGNDPRDLSGRAILAQQAGGAAQNEPLADALRQWTRRCFEMAWPACREFWTGERWLRVTDEMGDTQWMGLNRQVTLQDELGAMQPEQRAMAMQRLMLVPGDQRLGQVVRVENDIAGLEVDITIEEGVDVPAQAAEDFAAITQLVSTLPQLASPAMMEALIAASSLKGKGALLEAMRGKQEPPPPDPALIAMQEADIRGKHAKASADEALAVQRQHETIGGIARVHKEAAESYAIPVGAMGADALPPQPPPDNPPR